MPGIKSRQWDCGGIGRREGFKILCSQERVGPSPTYPTDTWSGITSEWEMDWGSEPLSNFFE
jgi:hypothetical protein